MQPHAPELEEAVIGACLIEQEALPLIADKLRPEMFYDDHHQLIFAALMAMYHAGKKIDILTVKEELARRGNLDAIGGPYAIVQLSSKVASSAHIEYRLEGESSHNAHIRDMETLMADTMEEAERRIAKSVNGVTGIPTGLTELDKKTGGLQDNDLIVIAARPSVGKTAFALHLARHAALAGNAVAVYSLEMQGERLGDRWLMAACNINPYRWRNGIPNPQEVAEARTTASGLAQLPIYVDDSSSVSMDHIRSSARLLKSRKQCDMIIIDYLQLCDMSTKQVNRNREQEVAQATRKAKLLAKELHIPVVLLSQLNRESENRPGGRPELAHLRESGAIEQDADIVILLYRPAMLHIPTDRESGYPTEGLGVAIVAKQRNGETGNVYFGHNQSITKFYDYVPPMEYLNKYAK